MLGRLFNMLARRSPPPRERLTDTEMDAVLDSLQTAHEAAAFGLLMKLPTARFLFLVTLAWKVFPFREQFNEEVRRRAAQRSTSVTRTIPITVPSSAPVGAVMGRIGQA